MARPAVAFLEGNDVPLRVVGRAARQMLTGIVTGVIPAPPGVREDGVAWGEVRESAVLTPKGKMVAALRLAADAGLRPGWGRELAPGEEDFLLLVPPAALQGLVAHLGRYLPPRLARLLDLSSEWTVVTLAGGRNGGGRDLEPNERFSVLGMDLPHPLEGDPPGASRSVSALHPTLGEVTILHSGRFPVPAWDVVIQLSALPGLRTLLEGAGVEAGTPELRETLRVEQGTPRYGAELDEDTIPVEAGMQHRAIDHNKGCYTGQEVIVRIRDRGRVNRHLRGLLLGDVPPPAPGTPLVRDGRTVGRVTTSVISPRFGGTIALGYVRREVEPPATVQLGLPDGLSVEVREITDEGWSLLPSDPG